MSMKKVFDSKAVLNTMLTAFMCTASAAFSGTNLVVNGTFDSGSLSPWTRNSTTGSAGKQGSVLVKTPGNTWINSSLASSCGSHAVAMQSYNYPNNSTYYNSTDSYIIQSFTVEDVGTYLVSFDYAGRGNGSAYWADAESYVRIFKGTDITATPIFTGAFTPTSNTSYASFRGRVQIAEPGVYTIQLLRPEPEGEMDKAVVIDNVSFACDHADNLICNGHFNAGSILSNTELFHPDADGSTAGYQTGGSVPAGFSCPGWDASGPARLGMRNQNSWTQDDPMIGRYSLLLQTYYYSNNYGGSGSASAWQTFSVTTGGTYEISFDYTGRRGTLYGTTPLYVRLYKGTDRTAAPVYEGSVTPTRNDQLMRFVGTVEIADSDAGDYTIELLQQQPETQVSDSSNDRTVIVDNVAFLRSSANLISNGNFENDEPSTGWNVTGNSVSYITRDSSVWVHENIPIGSSALVIQTYNLTSSWGDSGDKSVWHTFSVSSTGIYRLSLDFAGRYCASAGRWLFGKSVRVRVYSGEGIDGTCVFEGSFTPATPYAFQHYANYVSITAIGTYTLEFFQEGFEVAGSGGADSDNATIIDNVKLVEASGCSMVRWTGAVDGVVTNSGNWEGGSLPNADSIAYFEGDFEAQIPTGTTLECAGIVFADDATLTADCDWSGLSGVEMSGALDIAGKRFVLSSLSGCAAISSSSAGGVLEISTSEADDLAVNPSTAVSGENVCIEKTGAGTFISKIAQYYSGGTAVKGGIARPMDATSDICIGFNAFGEGDISVEEGATFDGRGHYGYGNIFKLAGGTLTSSISVSDTSEKGLGAMTLSADSCLVAGADHLVFGESGGTTDLGGNTLEISMNTGSNGSVYLCNSVITNGTLNVVSGGLLCTVSGNSVDASTVDLKMNCGFSLAADLSVHDYEALYSGTANAGSAALNVYGTFKPSSHDYFRGCTMQDGSTIDLSGRTTPLPLVSSSEGSATTLAFADGATIGICLDGRSVASDTQLVSWTTPPTNLDGLVFKAAHGEFGVCKRDDGLYISRGFMIIIR